MSVETTTAQVNEIVAKLNEVKSKFMELGEEARRIVEELGYYSRMLWYYAAGQIHLLFKDNFIIVEPTYSGRICLALRDFNGDIIARKDIDGAVDGKGLIEAARRLIAENFPTVLEVVAYVVKRACDFLKMRFTEEISSLRQRIEELEEKVSDC